MMERWPPRQIKTKHRLLCALFVCVCAISAAPQDASEFDYVKPLTAPDRNPGPVIDSSEAPILYTGKDNPDRQEDSNAITTPYIDSQDSFNDTPQSTTEQQYTKPSTTNEIKTEATERTLVTSEVPQNVSPRLKSPSPRFVSKLGYFKNSDKSFNSVGQTNFIERASKRKFKSRCRCEKITNCPKLQITVPRCPEELFLCCF
ncbi:unnamed protein product [Chilo suppressalis]|uniref:Uncharacterized protein n=1 Tax=Chilo suppressalis TaxID=168631 RepID=A0ABN8EB15_CHISP|nr:unnamed protein product [Chilo suppressalis]